MKLTNEQKTTLGNTISAVRYYGRRVIPRYVDAKLVNAQFRLYGLGSDE